MSESDLEDLASANRQVWAYQAHRPYVYPACPVCGYTGRAVKKGRGSRLTVLGLFLLACVVDEILLRLIILAAMFLYIVLNLGYVWKCAGCGAKRADA